MDHPETLPEKATAPPSRQQRGQAEAAELREGWRRLGRAATIVAIITSPAVFVWFDSVLGWSALASLAAAIVTVIIFRGFFDVVTRWMIPWPSTFGIADPDTLQNEVVARRRLWWWRSFFKLWVWLILIGIGIYLVGSLIWGALGTQTQSYLLASLPSYAISLPMLFLVNILILFGPFLAMSISQIKAYEPGDADWGVRLDDVRGQAEAKEEVRRVVSLWESGDQFEQAGGKRERGLLMLGAPGTGKTMLSKAVATGFNCPFVSIPGSGFAGMFIGMDILTVRYMAWKAKRLARKWGGQCIVFIDEIDAVGQRRSSLGTSMTADPVGVPSIHDFCFYGPDGALTSSGDLVIETREWRDRLFAMRARARARGIGRVHGARDGDGRPDRRAGRHVRPGQRGAEFAAGGDGRHRRPAVLAAVLGEPAEHLDGRQLHRPAADRQNAAAPEAAEAGQRADLLHRCLQRAHRVARSGTDAAGPHGPPRLVPHADQG